MSREQMPSHVHGKDTARWPVPEGKKAEQKKPKRDKFEVKAFDTQEKENIRAALTAIELKAYIEELHEDMARRSSQDAKEAEETYGEDRDLVEATIQGLRKPKDAEERKVYLSTLQQLKEKYPGFEKRLH